MSKVSSSGNVTGIVCSIEFLATFLPFTDSMLHRGRVVETGAAASFLDAPQTAEARAFLAGQLLI